MRRLLAILAVVGVSSCGRPVRVSPGAERVEPVVRVLSLNDVYVADALRDGTGGVARVAYLRDSLARRGPLLFLLAGDVLAPSLLSKWYGGSQMVEVFNAAKLDYATLGNHEFDITQAQLESRLRESRFKWVAANCRRADGTSFPNVRGWDTVRTAGVLVGVVGATLVTRYPRWVRCTEPETAVHAALDTLQRAGARFIVGLTHLSVRSDSALLANEPRIDLIVGGHEHTQQRVEIGQRLVRKADSDARTAVLVDAFAQGDRWRVVDQLVPINAMLPSEPATAGIAARWADSLVRHLGPVRVLGQSAEPLDLRDSAGRNGEGRFGNLVTDAMRAGTGADVALLNGGALRLDDLIEGGPITNHQLESIFLFADETRVVVFEVTGALLKEQLTHNVRTQVGVGGYLQVSGIRYGYDATRPSAEREVLHLSRTDGRAILDTDRLRLAAVGYMACNGGDGYTMVDASRDACAGLGRAPRTVDLLMAYVASMPGGRIVQPPIDRVSTSSR